MSEDKKKNRKKNLMRRISPVLGILTVGLVFSILLNCAAIIYTRYEQKQYAMMAVKANMDFRGPGDRRHYQEPGEDDN